MNVAILIALVWSIRILANIFSYIYLWYVKEYRFDRMYIHLASPQGKNILFPTFRRPPIRVKTVILCIGSIFVLVMLPGSLITKLFFADILSFPIVSLLVFLTKIPTYLYHALLIRRAVRALRTHTPMIVIGITGSYGKTSTKEILQTLLRQKYKVLATEASKNSPIGIAELVLKKLKKDTEVFIVEMGAYKKGEIAYMCGMVRPEIGIVTAVNAQHQDLFKTLDNTIAAKFELIEGLHGRKIAIMNQDNVYVAQMMTRAKTLGCTTIAYSTKGISVQQEENGIRFGDMRVHLFGTHQASNVLAAIEAAKHVGMTKTEILHALKNIHPTPHTMHPMKGIRGSIFIDDTFNNNPDAAIAALEYLALQPGRKILVFQPMIELGEYAEESHRRVGNRAREVCDEIILTNDSYAYEFSAKVLSAEAAAKYLKTTVGLKDTVLFKGKEAGRVLQLLL